MSTTFIGSPNIETVSKHGSLAGAYAAIGSVNKRTILVDEDTTVTSNLTIGQNVTLQFVTGCVITASSGVTLTLYCDVVASLQQIFNSGTGSTGTVRFIRGGTVYPEWWGAVGDGDLGIAGATDDSLAIQAALDSLKADNGGILQFASKIYYTGSTTLKWQSVFAAGTLVIRGSGKYVGSHIRGSGSNIIFDFIGSDGFSVEDITIDTFSIASGGTACGVGVLLARRDDSSASSAITFKNVTVIGEFTKAAVYSINSESNSFIGCRVTNNDATTLSYGFYTSTENDLNVTPDTYTIGETADGWTNSVCNFIGGSISHSGASGAALGIFGGTRIFNFEGIYFSSQLYGILIGPSSAVTTMLGPININGCSFEGGASSYGIYLQDHTLLGLNITKCLFSINGGSGTWKEIYQEDQTGSNGISLSNISDNLFTSATNISISRAARSKIADGSVQLRLLGFGMEWVNVQTLTYEAAAQDQGAVRHGLVDGSSHRRMQLGPPNSTTSSDFTNNSMLQLWPSFTDPSPVLADKGLCVIWDGQYNSQPNFRVENQDGNLRPTIMMWTGYEYITLANPRQELALSELPKSGGYTVGDIIWKRDADHGESPYWQCTDNGYASSGVWTSAWTYGVGDRVLGSDNQVYEATSAGGQAEDPVLDGDNTYWTLEGDPVGWSAAAPISSGILDIVVNNATASGVLTVTDDIEITQSGSGYIQTSPDGTRWRIQVDNTGTITTTAI